MDQTGDESAGSGERIQNIDHFIGQAAVELLFQYVLDGMDHEIDDFYRGIEDSEFLDGLGESSLEKVAIELLDQVLLGLQSLYATGLETDVFVEFLQTAAFCV